MEGEKHNIWRNLVYLLGTMLMIGSLGCISLAAGVYAMDEQTEVTTWEELQAAFNKGGEIILKRSVTAGQSDGPLIIPGGVQVTLNLNGRNIDRGLENAEARSDGCVIINNGSLTITDSSYGYKGRITGGNNSGDGGGIVNKGVLVLENGTITHNKAGNSGGGIHNTGRLTMTGGIISYNTAVSYHGGGIYNNGTLTLSGGQIQENKTLGAESKGQGGAILQNGTMNVSGNPIVKNNTAQQGNNIYLRAEHPTMTVTGAFTDGAILGVTSAGKKGVITSNYSRYNGQDKDPQFIFNSDEGYLIRLINDEAKIVSGASLVRYFRRSWDGSKVDRTFIETDEYTLISDVKDSGSTQLETGLYIARDNITFKNRIGVAPGAEVTLVLCDSSNLTMKKGIRVNGSKSKLIICGQTFDSGVLEAASGSDTPIGADSKKEGGIIEIHGGSITAKTKGENPSAAIGGAKQSPSSGIIRIYGGGVEAISDYSGAGIGSGEESPSPEIMIYGGTVNAVAADGAAIGAGGNYKTTNQDYGSYGPIKIYGGVVNAQAAGAGIGAGNNNQNPSIEINGGEITAICKANGESGAGIGAGRYADQTRNIEINGGLVIAISEGGAGIGAGSRYDGGNIDINNGTVFATSTNGGAGIGGGRRGGDGGTVKIRNGRVIAAALKTNEGLDAQNRFNEMATAFEAGGHNNKGLTGAMLFQTIGNIIRATSDDDSGAGIGGGYNGKGGDVEITGGYVVASASTGKARAIGHGTGNSSVGKLSLHRGAAVYTGKNEKSADYTPFEDRVTACQSNRYALILPCLHENSTCTVTETTHRIICPYCTQLSEKPEPHEWNETNDHCVICNYHKALPEYTIQYDPNGGEGEPRQIKKTSGAEYELLSCSFTPPEGKIFDRWLVTIGESASVLKNPGQDITVTDDITVKALWKELHTVIFVAEDGTEGVPPAQTVGSGEKALKPDEPNREGYAFRYWKLQGTEKEYSFNSEVLNDIILEAVWEKLQTELIITARSKTCVYNGESQGPSGAYTNRIDTYVTVEGLKDGDALTGITLSGCKTDAGEYVITPSAAVVRGKTSNYSSIIYREGTLTITKASNPAVIVAAAAVTKGGNTVNLSKNVKYAAGDVTYAITGEAKGCKVDKNTGLFTSGDETGTCVVTVTATESANYLGTKKNITVSVEDREIVPLHVTESDTLYEKEAEDPVYTGPDGNPISIPDGSTVEISYNGNSYGPSKDKPVDAGRYAVTVTIGTSDTFYTGTAAFEIIPKEIRVSADDKTKTFNDLDPEFTATLTDIDGKPADGAEVSYTLSRIPGENVGEYSIAPSGSFRQGNYFVSYITGTLTITKASNPAVIDDSAAVTKGGNTVDLSRNVKDAASDLTYAITGEANGCKVDADKGLFTSGDKAGTCIVTVTAAESDNFLAATKRITVSVEDKEIVPLRVTQDDAVYGEEPEDPTYTGPDGSPVSILDGSTVSISYSGSSYEPSQNKPTDVGKYTVTVRVETSDKIYTGKAAFSIERKEVTVKAENEYKIYGDEDPVLEADVSVKGESDSAEKIDYTLNRIPGENAGQYQITPSGAVIQGNYIVSYLPGTLTIGPADADRLGLKASGYEGIYDAQVHTVEASVDLTEGTVIEYSTDDGDTWSPTAPGIRDADEEGLTVLVRARNQNYRKALEEVTLIVKKADSAVITAPQANKLAYNGSKQKLITAGEAKGGKMQYALGTKTEATESYSSSVPEVTDAGTYYVWYKSKGDQNHHDSEAKYVIAKIDTTIVTVTFVDGLGNTMKTEKVEGGKAAAAPDAPIRDGYTFVGWDKDFSRVTSDMTVTALWKENAKTENAKTVNGVLLAKLLTKGQSKLVLSWNKINGVQGYDIFFGKSSKKKSKLTGSVKGNKTSKWTFKKLKKNTSYKAYVKAWIMKDGKKVYVAACPTVYEYTSGGTKQYTNAVSITVKKKKITLKAGRTYTVKAKIKKQRKGRKLMPGKQAAPLRYLSTAPKAAKVTKKGKIKALKKGTSYIYVFAHNGVNRKVQVVVR